jgi:hypothetical protein
MRFRRFAVSDAFGRVTVYGFDDPDAFQHVRIAEHFRHLCTGLEICIFVLKLPLIQVQGQQLFSSDYQDLLIVGTVHVLYDGFHVHSIEIINAFRRKIISSGDAGTNILGIPSSHHKLPGSTV